MASMESSMRSGLVLSVFLCLLMSLASARPDIASQPKLHIVYLGKIAHTGPNAQSSTLSHHQSILATVFDSPEEAQTSVLYNYKQSFSGFAAQLTEEQASSLRENPDVVSVFESGIRPLTTTFSWKYLGLNASAPTNVWPRSNYGDGVIIGLLDTGVWPESESFSDTGFGPIPSKWKGSCAGIVCNKKLIGAKVFLKGQGSTESVRDVVGHGTHTSSTAGGSPVSNVSFFGITQGTTVGGAPKAHIAMYKVCTDNGCTDADILAAFDEAIADGVDILSVSVGGFVPLLQDSIAIGSFHGLEKDVLVSASAGNEGPALGSASNSVPWLLTVAASTIPRDFVTTVRLGNGKVVQGTSLNPFRDSVVAPLIGGSSGCSQLNISNFKGKIVVCAFDLPGFDDVVKDAGGVGLVLVFDGLGPVAFAFNVPTSVVTTAQAETITSYIASTKNANARIFRSGAVFNFRPAPQVAPFSSRGPAGETPQVLKPDLTAPGVDILASWTPKVPVSGKVTSFNIISGTSMSCPHASGSAALIKAVHPTWSPQAIKSALMTTATPLDTSLSSNSDFALGFGSGQIDPNAAANPGLLYDAGVEDHALFLCGIGLNSTAVRLIAGSSFSCPAKRQLPQPRDLNYPSISFLVTPSDKGKKIVVKRTVTNVGPAASTYQPSLKQGPSPLSFSIAPANLIFTSQGQKLSFTVTLDSNGFHAGVNQFASLVWADEHGHKVGSPVFVSSAN